MENETRQNHEGTDKYDPRPEFVHTSQNKESGHAIGITKAGIAYSWSIRKRGPINEFGQLGQGSTSNYTKAKLSNPAKVSIALNDKHNKDTNQNHSNAPSKSTNIQFVRAFTGGTHESGHSALLDITRQNLYLCGCDRWQQLGLGSHRSGALGYTWRGGKIWQMEFTKNEFLDHVLVPKEDFIRDVALGADHTVILTDKNRHVFTFGRGGDGQLGGVGKPFVSAPMKSNILSSKSVSSVCAIKDCTITLNEEGNLLKMVGKCQSKDIQAGLLSCRNRAKKDGLLL